MVSILAIILLVLTIPLIVCVESESQENPRVIRKTDIGTMKLEVFQDIVPNKAANFIDLADSEFSDEPILPSIIYNFCHPDR